MSDTDLKQQLIGTWTCYRWNEKRAVLTLQHDGQFSLRLDSDSSLKRLLQAMNVRGYEGVWDAHEKRTEEGHSYITLRQRRADAPLFKPTPNPLIALSSHLHPITFDIIHITANEVTLQDTEFSIDYGNKWVRF